VKSSLPQIKRLLSVLIQFEFTQIFLSDLLHREPSRLSNLCQVEQVVLRTVSPFLPLELTRYRLESKVLHADDSSRIRSAHPKKAAGDRVVGRQSVACKGINEYGKGES